MITYYEDMRQKPLVCDDKLSLSQIMEQQGKFLLPPDFDFCKDENYQEIYRLDHFDELKSLKNKIVLQSHEQYELLKSAFSEFNEHEEFPLEKYDFQYISDCQGQISYNEYIELVQYEESLPEPDENGFVIKDGVLLDYVGDAKDVIIPEGVTEIGGGAFFMCYSPRNIAMPDSVTNIGTGAFCGCVHLKAIELSKNLKSVGADAFNLCGNLEKVCIKDLDAWNNIEFSDGYSDPVGSKVNLYLNGEPVTNVESRENDELTPLEDINLAPDIESLRKECDEIMASDEKMVYDEITPNKSKDAR